MGRTYLCPDCGATTTRYREKKTHYKSYFDRQGSLKGDYRYFAQYCPLCTEYFYIEQLRLNTDTEWGMDRIVDESEYNTADENVASMKVGSTSSQYSKRVSKGADRYRWTYA